MYRKYFSLLTMRDIESSLINASLFRSMWLIRESFRLALLHTAGADQVLRAEGCLSLMGHGIQYLY